MAENRLLREVIDRTGYKKTAVAEKAGMSPSALSKVLKGRRKPTQEERRSLSKVLGVSQKLLFDEGSVGFLAGLPTPLPAEQSIKAGTTTQENGFTQMPRKEKVRLTVQVWPETLERVRRAVYWTPGETVSGFVERVLNQAVDAAEKQRGEVFPDRTGPLKLGRPLR